MLRPSMEQILKKMDQTAASDSKTDAKNLSYYSVVIGIAKRAHEISQQRYDEKEHAKKAAETRKANDICAGSQGTHRRKDAQSTDDGGKPGQDRSGRICRGKIPHRGTAFG